MSDLIYRQDAIIAVRSHRIDINDPKKIVRKSYEDVIRELPSAEPEIAENLYLCKCYITDKDGLQHEVIHTGDIRRVTGWEI